MLSPVSAGIMAAKMTRQCLVLLLAGRALAQSALPGTAPLTDKSDFAAKMVDGINDYLLRATDDSVSKRASRWNPNYQSADAYEQSVAKNRERLKKIIGAVDHRIPFDALTLNESAPAKDVIASGPGYKVYAARWPVLDGMTAEGLLLEPDRPPVARVVAIPDADWSPEMLAGLAPGAGAKAQFALSLAENGCQVLVPVILDRNDTWSGVPGLRMTNQPHREWVYRMAYETGRHVIGYEVQKVLAAVDWFAGENRTHAAPIAVAGYGEGGLLALYSAAVDPRIQAAVVSGYFQSRQAVWEEPIYRDVWGLLHEFGDAELASLIAPRALIVEASRGPKVDGPPPVTKERSNATPNGRLATPALSSVRAEVERAKPLFASLKAESKLRLVESGGGAGEPGSEAGARRALLQSMGVNTKLKPSEAPPKKICAAISILLFACIGNSMRWFPTRRCWCAARPMSAPSSGRKADAAPRPSAGKESTRFHRDYIWDEVIGRMPAPSNAANPRTRLIYDEPKFRGYEVVLDVWPGVIAYGILNIPKDIKPGEKRPVVVLPAWPGGPSK